MKISKTVYLLLAVLGTIVPWFFFASFLANEGLNLPLFVSSLFENSAAGGFVADVLISAVIFLLWSYADAQQKKVKQWWVVIPAVFTVGLSLALPLYLYLRPEE